MTKIECEPALPGEVAAVLNSTKNMYTFKEVKNNDSMKLHQTILIKISKPHHESMHFPGKVDALELYTSACLLPNFENVKQAQS